MLAGHFPIPEKSSWQCVHDDSSTAGASSSESSCLTAALPDILLSEIVGDEAVGHPDLPGGGCPVRVKPRSSLRHNFQIVPI
jgi:hypothetical protein